MGPACPVTTPPPPPPAPRIRSQGHGPRARHGDLTQAGSVHPGAHVEGRSYLKADGRTVIVNATRVPRASQTYCHHPPHLPGQQVCSAPAPHPSGMSSVGRSPHPPAACRSQQGTPMQAFSSPPGSAVNRMQMANAQTFTTNCRWVTESLGGLWGECQFLKKELSVVGPLHPACPGEAGSVSVTEETSDRPRAEGLRMSPQGARGRSPCPFC